MEGQNKTSVVSPYFTFFLIHSLQIGVGILGFQRIIIKPAGYDAWISILLIGLATHVVLFFMLKMLEKDNDLIEIHATCFGKWLGTIFTLCFTLYFILSSLAVLRTYIEVIQVWIFPNITLWHITLIFLFIIYYILAGGFRSVTGICFFSVMLPILVTFFLIFPLQYANFRNVLPIFTHSFTDILKSAKAASLEFLGIEALLLFYPLIRKEKSVKYWAHLGIFFTTVLYLLVALVSFFYFSEGLLNHTIWATLAMLKIIRVPFIQRVEYIIIFLWFLIILPNLCLTIWASCQSVKRSLRIPFKITVPFFLFILYISSLPFTNRDMVNALNAYTSQIGFYLVYVYIPILFLWHTIRFYIKNKTPI